MNARRLLVVTLAMAVLASACSVLPGGGADPTLVTAAFPRAANLFVGSEVRVLGLAVGEVTDIQALGDRVEVTMELDPERQYPADATVTLQPVSLLGERFAQIDPPYTGGPTLQNGAEIPIERTGIPAEVDEVLRSFENFLESLDAGALAELIDVLADTLDGNGQGLNDLVASGADTVRVLADSSVDLNQVVGDLASLNESLATREERIGSTLINTSTVLRNLQEDRELLIGALTELTRATAELAPVLEDHGDPLVADLEVLATSLSTVDRNLSRLGTTFYGGQRLFHTAGRIIDYENARLPLDNEFGPLVEFIRLRLEDRLVGLCLRLDLSDCDSVEEIVDLLPDLCLPGLCARDEEGEATFAEAIGIMVTQLSPESQAAIAADIEGRQGDPQPAAEPAPTATTAPEATPSAGPTARPSAQPPAPSPSPSASPSGQPSDPEVLPVPTIPGYSGGAR